MVRSARDRFTWPRRSMPSKAPKDSWARTNDTKLSTALVTPDSLREGQGPAGESCAPTALKVQTTEGDDVQRGVVHKSASPQLRGSAYTVLAGSLNLPKQ